MYSIQYKYFAQARSRIYVGLPSKSLLAVMRVRLQHKAKAIQPLSVCLVLYQYEINGFFRNKPNGVNVNYKSFLLQSIITPCAPHPHCPALPCPPAGFSMWLAPNASPATITHCEHFLKPNQLVFFREKKRKLCKYISLQTPRREFPGILE